jgi:hypothetical protein
VAVNVNVIFEVVGALPLRKSVITPALVSRWTKDASCHFIANGKVQLLFWLYLSLLALLLVIID